MSAGLALRTALAVFALALTVAACGDARRRTALRAAPPPAPKRSIVFEIERHRLANGMQVILHESHEVPLVAVNLFYRIGSRDDPAGRSGFAHLLEHLMFEGSRPVAKSAFLSVMGDAGASDTNATTELDYTTYYETLPSDRLALALWLESDRLAHAIDRLDDAALVRERQAIKNERREHVDEVAAGLVPEFIREAMYPPTHPYRRLSVGTPADLDATTLDELRDFFHTYYVPDNVTLVVAGDYDPRSVQSLVARYFAPIPRGTTPRPKTTAAPTQLEREVLVDVEAGVESARVFFDWPTPASFAPGDAELDIAERVLGYGPTSRLYRRLVQGDRIALSVSVRHPSYELGGRFEIAIAVTPGQTVDRAIEVVDDELERLAKTLADEAELRPVRYGIFTGRVFHAERLAARAELLNIYQFFGGSPRSMQRDLDRLQAVSPVALRDAVAAHLPRDRRVVTVVKPVDGAPLAGRRVGVR